ncbi:hypothetical protein BS47DRAFT_1355381 [Hydnum rufescens UP504]|uniref:Uncharacterized protein n=1 Tax=Hydnum rufescens UP504 TaxID=1448309 RepID=A0A9P6DI88_9AGAM|nr:hypothetical protein BS47DRAFT_1355381 [Hydnum rufescens UP504]
MHSTRDKSNLGGHATTVLPLNSPSKPVRRSFPLTVPGDCRVLKPPGRGQPQPLIRWEHSSLFDERNSQFAASEPTLSNTPPSLIRVHRDHCKKVQQ